MTFSKERLNLKRLTTSAVFLALVITGMVLEQFMPPVIFGFSFDFVILFLIIHALVNKGSYHLIFSFAVGLFYLLFGDKKWISMHNLSFGVEYMIPFILTTMFSFVSVSKKPMTRVSIFVLIAILFYGIKLFLHTGMGIVIGGTDGGMASVIINYPYVLTHFGIMIIFFPLLDKIVLETKRRYKGM